MIVDKNSPIPLYFQLQTWLIEQIDQGVIRPNEQIPTEEELVGKTGLARATVRQAIQNLVNLGYLFRKRGLGTFVIDRKADDHRQTIVGVLVPDIRGGYAPELARGTGDEAARNQHSIIICNTDDSLVRADIHADRLIEHAVGGVIFVPTAASDKKNRSLVEKFTRKNIPVVLADRAIPDVEIDCVTTDNFHGAYELTKYLILKGHEKIAILLSTLFTTENQRLEGYKQALTEHHIPVDPSLIFAKPEPYVEKVYLEHVRAILRQQEKFTAVFAGHDRIAYLFYSVAHEMGISIPEDLSLIGYDDLAFANSYSATLTTMHQPIHEMGEESMKLLLSRIGGDQSGPKKIVLRSRLVERASVLDLVSHKLTRFS
ncbi:MAG: GntR family transcriptional regulator [bacterium]